MTHLLYLVLYTVRAKSINPFRFRSERMASADHVSHDTGGNLEAFLGPVWAQHPT